MKIVEIRVAALVMTFVCALFLGSALVADAQTQPTFVAYRGISIGMPSSDVREILGKAKERSDERDFYEFDNENAQVVYDEDQTVKTISINYVKKLDSAPTAKEVLGTDIPAGDDGYMYKMVNFNSKGYWASFVKTGGDDPMIIVTLQKIPKLD